MAGEPIGLYLLLAGFAAVFGGAWYGDLSIVGGGVALLTIGVAYEIAFGGIE